MAAGPVEPSMAGFWKSCWGLRRSDPLCLTEYDIVACQYVGFCEMIFKARKPLTSGPRTA